MSEQIISSRLQACASCPHNVRGFCGTPIIGSDAFHRGRWVKLCGCLMKIKARLPNSTCPIDRWPLEMITSEAMRVKMLEDVVPEAAVSSKPIKGKDLNEIRVFLAEIKDMDNIPWQTMQKLVKIHTKYVYPVQETGCTPCLMQMIKNLKASVKQKYGGKHSTC